MEGVGILLLLNCRGQVQVAMIFTLLMVNEHATTYTTT
jgi:hypothetical protein